MHFPWQKHSTRSRKKCYELSLENLDAQRNSPPSSDCSMMTWLEKCCRTAYPLKDLISRMEWDKDACLLRCNSTYTSLKCYSLPYLGIYILDRLDGSLIDLSCLTAKTKTLKRLLIEALFADDSTLMAHIELHLQVIVGTLYEAVTTFGLTISLSKTEILLQPAQGTHPQQPCIIIDDTQLKIVESFKYLGSTSPMMELWTGKSRQGFRKQTLYQAEFVPRSYSTEVSICLPSSRSTTQYFFHQYCTALNLALSTASTL